MTTAIEEEDDGKISPPWDGQTVQKLNEYQRIGQFHPYTCGNNRDDKAHRDYQAVHGGDFGQLVATTDGWICPVCHYTQAWAWNPPTSGLDFFTGCR